MPHVPNPAEWQGRLDYEVHKLQDAASYREVTYNRLKELVAPPNDVDLLKAVSRMISTGQISVIYRVISPVTNAAIGQYPSPLEVPREMVDESTGHHLDIDPVQNVETVYVSEGQVEH
ncbi:hypothetical protein LP7551_05290 [Roseibium album]|nr:hypothetical protein LP7551_05290 [Roseibium album]